jgi:hypothetical protein
MNEKKSSSDCAAFALFLNEDLSSSKLKLCHLWRASPVAPMADLGIWSDRGRASVRSALTEKRIHRQIRDIWIKATTKFARSRRIGYFCASGR